MSEVAMAAMLAPSTRRRVREKFMMMSPQGRNLMDAPQWGK